MLHIFSRVHETLYITMSVHPSVGLSVITSHFWAIRAERRADLSYFPWPGGILPLSTRTRLILSCIRPCFVSETNKPDLLPARGSESLRSGHQDFFSSEPMPD